MMSFLANILIADDHPIIRSGLKAILRNNFNVNRIDYAANEAQIVNNIKHYKYDLVILDINMPDTNFMGTLEWICDSLKETNVLVFSMYEESIYGLRCLNAGAKGFLNKACTDEELISAIKLTLKGNKYISYKIADIAFESQRATQPLNPFHCLNSKELEIAICLSKGIPLFEIGKLHNIQYAMVNAHRKRILEKLNVQTVISMIRLMALFNIA